MPLLTQNRAGENARERRQRAGRRARGVVYRLRRREGRPGAEPLRHVSAPRASGPHGIGRTGREGEVIRLRESLGVCISCGQREAAPGSVYCKSHRACRRYTWRKYSKKVGRTSQLSLREQPHA